MPGAALRDAALRIPVRLAACVVLPIVTVPVSATVPGVPLLGIALSRIAVRTTAGRAQIAFAHFMVRPRIRAALSLGASLLLEAALLAAWIVRLLSPVSNAL
jgi:hypothetical protein